MHFDRRTFIKNMAISGCTIVCYSYLGGTFLPSAHASKQKNTFAGIVANHLKCTGCRTCECVCSSYNHKENIAGESLPGLGNPYFSNIQVTSFNPDIDVPTVCALCPDAPCVNACPVEPDENGEKAMYRNKALGIVKCHIDRCIGCGSCKEACKSQSVGIIRSNQKTNVPERMCTLCYGTPQCVKHCPYHALSHVKIEIDSPFYRLSQELVAEKLMAKWYYMQQRGE